MVKLIEDPRVKEALVEAVRTILDKVSKSDGED